MAKFFLVILAICFLGASGVRFTEDKVAFKNATWKKCQEQENAPDEGMKEFYAFNSMEGLKDHKCAVKCINEEYGLYLKNGTISRPRLVQIIHYLSKDPKTRENLIATTDECIASVADQASSGIVRKNCINCKHSTYKQTCFQPCTPPSYQRIRGIA
uniref:Odorant-binding protein 1 n=1 Tax=Eocanthecona furcellata TaxID=696902 RepID=A0AAT9TYI9_9HEMI